MALVGALLAPTSLGKVYVRWTLSGVPPAKVVGVNELVIPWGDAAKSLVEAAKKQGYRVYLEASVEQAAAAAEAGASSGVAGIILQGGASEDGRSGRERAEVAGGLSEAEDSDSGCRRKAAGDARVAGVQEEWNFAGVQPDFAAMAGCELLRWCGTSGHFKRRGCRFTPFRGT